MTTSLSKQAKLYVERVQVLYKLVEETAQRVGFATAKNLVHLNEESAGEYDVTQLELTVSGNQKVFFTPVGASIIGAEGRVDLRGKLGTENILYLKTGGPTLTSLVKDFGPKEDQSSTFFKGIGDDGWYWIESVRLGKAQAVTEGLLLELINSVK